LKIMAIVQARMGSTRLPGKVLKPILGKPMLWHVVKRLYRARRVDEVVVATTTRAADYAIVSLCETEGWLSFRGSAEDVLDRYYQSALRYKAEVIVRITADCPLIDPKTIDQVIKEFVEARPAVDYASNTLPPRTFPRGLDVEVMSMAALTRAWLEDTNPAWREHVTPYIYRNPKRFRLLGVYNSADFSGLRWTVDTFEDLTLVCKIFEHFGDNAFSWDAVCRLLAARPEWREINARVEQKVVP